MKSMDNEKRILSNMKQEDHKPNLNLNNASSLKVDGPSTSDHNIKQEDTEEYNNILQQDGEFGKEGYYYRCNVCNKRMANLKSVLEHRSLIHNVRPMARLTIKDIDTEPDIHDSNFYCKPCNVAYDKKSLYRQHLKQTHYMALKPIPRWKPPRNNIVPDPDDPNMHCRACDRTYKGTHNYKKHCLHAHGVKPVKPANQRSTLGKMVNTYCKSCDRRFASKYSYQKHLAGIHKVNWRQIQQKPNNVIPDINDPNFYCRSCDKILACKRNYQIHLRLVHSIDQSGPKKSSLDIDINDPENCCRACRKTFPTRGKYRNHLRLAHQMTFPSLRVVNNSGDLPDPHNPHYYCSICKRHLKTRSRYRYHCKTFHFMELSHSSIFYPDATIDTNDPNSYCAQCEHSYATKLTFKRHLAKVHNI